ncbi:MAG: PIN domain-containing protein [Deltaproteobacteria bacterium]|nr:PIN domain-containing protein [Deltaproteobacteria bacterium]
MTHRTEEISTYDFKSSEALLLDANIWLFVYGPQKPTDTRVTTYSEALAKILAAKSCIYIDVLIVSEFVNTYARLKWRLLPESSRPIYFKQFRKSTEFNPVARDIAADVKRMLQHCTRVESGFESLAIDTLVDEYAAGDSDFNDQILTALCKNKGLTMVTDDADFKGQGIPIITANKRLLS